VSVGDISTTRSDDSRAERRHPDGERGRQHCRNDAVRFSVPTVNTGAEAGGLFGLTLDAQGRACTSWMTRTTRWVCCTERPAMRGGRFMKRAAPRRCRSGPPAAGARNRRLAAGARSGPPAAGAEKRAAPLVLSPARARGTRRGLRKASRREPPLPRLPGSPARQRRARAAPRAEPSGGLARPLQRARRKRRRRPGAPEASWPRSRTTDRRVADREAVLLHWGAQIVAYALLVFENSL